MNSESEQEMAVKFMPLVHLEANLLLARMPPFYDRDEIVSDGQFGLSKAIKKFDPSKEGAFYAYAKRRITGEMLDGIRRRDPVSRGIRGQNAEIQKASERLAVELGREPTSSEIADELEMSVSEFQKHISRGASICIVPLDSPIAGSDEQTVADFVLDHQQPEPDRVAHSNQLTGIVMQAMQSMPHRDRSVLCLYFIEGFNLSEIAQSIGCTESRLCANS